MVGDSPRGANNPSGSDCIDNWSSRCGVALKKEQRTFSRKGSQRVPLSATKVDRIFCLTRTKYSSMEYCKMSDRGWKMVRTDLFDRRGTDYKKNHKNPLKTGLPDPQQ